MTQQIEVGIDDDGVTVTVSDDSDAYSADRLDDMFTRAVSAALEAYRETRDLRDVAEQEAE